jgi:hypothetical protein
VGCPGRQEIFLKCGLVRLRRATGSLRGVDLREQVAVAALQLVDPREGILLCQCLNLSAGPSGAWNRLTNTRTLSRASGAASRSY